MSKLRFDVRTVPLSRLIINLANPTVLASALPPGVTHTDVVEAVDEIADEIDRRVPLVNRKAIP